MNISYSFELLGAFFFAISGALVLKDKDHDWLGAGFTGFITAIGGGSVRDMLLGAYPLVWVNDPNVLYAIFAGLVLASFAHEVLGKLKRTLRLFDTLGIGFFTILGTEKALLMGVHPVTAALMGMVSAVMGGVLRDTLTNETPVIFRPEIYATACLFGASVYLLAHYLGAPQIVTFALGLLAVVSLRLAAIKFGLTLPKFFRK